MFKDFSIREKMINDFGFGTEDQIGASRDLLYPFMWVNLVGTQYVDNALCESYHFQISFLDKVTSGEDNYIETLSNAQYIYRQFIGEIKQHPYWDDMGLSLQTNQLSGAAVYLENDQTVQGFKIDIWIKQPVRITYCNSPIVPITSYTTVLDTEQGNAYRIIGAQGPQGTQGPAGSGGTGSGSQGPQGYQGTQGNNGTNGINGATGTQGPQGNNGNNGATGPQGFQGVQGVNGLNGVSGVNGATGTQGPQGNNGNNGSIGATGPQGHQGSNGLNGIGVSGATGPQGYQGPAGSAGGSFIYSKTLFVDPNGNNVSAVAGDITKPWQYIGSAVQYLQANTLTGYTIWVFPGSYNETTIWDINNNNTGTTIKLNGGVFISSPLLTLIRVSQAQLTIVGDDEGKAFQINNASINAPQILILNDNSTCSITNVYLNSSNGSTIITNGSNNNVTLFLNNCYLEASNGNNISDNSPSRLNMSIRNCFLNAHRNGTKMTPNILMLNPAATTNNIQIHNSRLYTDGNGTTIYRGMITTNAQGGNPAYWITMSDVVFYGTALGVYMWYDIDPTPSDSNNIDVIANVIGNTNTLFSAGCTMINTTAGTTVLAGSININSIINYNR